jgi:hypothetical protein
MPIIQLSVDHRIRIMMDQVSACYSFSDRIRGQLAKESAKQIEDQHASQMALIDAQIKHMRTLTK